MKRSVLSFILILIAGVLVLRFSGCTKEEEEDLTDWTIIPRSEKEDAETEEAVKPEEETEQAIIESQPLTHFMT